MEKLFVNPLAGTCILRPPAAVRQSPPNLKGEMGKWGNGEMAKRGTWLHELKILSVTASSNFFPFPHFPKVLFQVAELMLEQRRSDDGRGLGA